MPEGICFCSLYAYVCRFKFLKNVREPKNIFHNRAVGLDLPVDLVSNRGHHHRQLALNNYIYIKRHHSSLQPTYLAYFHLKSVKRFVPELFVSSMQIDVDCTCFFDTEGFQHVPLLYLWTLTLDVPQMARRS